MWQSEQIEMYDDCEKNGLVNIIREEEIGKNKNGVSIKKTSILQPLYHTTVMASYEVTIDMDGNCKNIEKVEKNNSLTVAPGITSNINRSSNVAPLSLTDKAGYLDHAISDIICDKAKDRCNEYLNLLEDWCIFEKDKIEKEKGNNNEPFSVLDVLKAVHKYVSNSTLHNDLSKVAPPKNDKTLNELINICQRKDNTPEVLKAKKDIKEAFDKFIRFTVIVDGNTCVETWKSQTIANHFIDYYESKHQPKLQEDIDYFTGNKMRVIEIAPAKIRGSEDMAKLIGSPSQNGIFTYSNDFIDGSKKRVISIGEKSCGKVYSMLSYLIKKQGFNIGSAAVLIYRYRPHNSNPSAPLLELFNDDYQSVIQNDGYTLSVDKMRKASNGYTVDFNDIDDSIRILVFDSLGGNKGHLGLIYNQQLSTSSYVDNIKKWYELSSWDSTYFRKDKNNNTIMYIGYGTIPLPLIRKILLGTEDPNNNNKLVVSQKAKEKFKHDELSILSCIVMGHKIPKRLVDLAINNAMTPVKYKDKNNWEKALALACSFSKNYISTMRKGEYFMNNFGCEKTENAYKIKTAEEIEAIMDTNRDRSFLYGRLAAMADRAEDRYLCNRKLDRPTHVLKNFNYIVNTPVKTWSNILFDVTKVINTMEKKYRISWHNEFARITDMFNAEDFIKKAPLDKGMFLLGFSQQRTLYKKKKIEADKKEAEKQKAETEKSESK